MEVVENGEGKYRLRVLQGGRKELGSRELNKVIGWGAETQTVFYVNAVDAIYMDDDSVPSLLHDLVLGARETMMA